MSFNNYRCEYLIKITGQLYPAIYYQYIKSPKSVFEKRNYDFT